MRILFVELHASDKPVINAPLIVARIMRRRGHAVTFLTTESRYRGHGVIDTLKALRPNRSFSDGIEFCNSPYIRFPFGVSELSATFFSVLFARLILRKRHFDTIIVGNVCSMGFIGVLLGKFFDCPVIADFGDPYWTFYSNSLFEWVPAHIGKTFERFVLTHKGISKIFVPAQMIGSYVQKNYPGKLAILCPAGYFADEMASLKDDPVKVRMRLSLVGKKVVLCGGALSRRFYRSDILLRTAALVIESDPEVVFVVAGRIGDSETSRDMVRLQKSTTRFRYLGMLPRETYLSVLDASDICVSINESTYPGLKSVEYMIHGKPAVISMSDKFAHGGFFRKGYNCLITSLDEKALARGIIQLLRNPDQARDLAERARETFAGHTWDNYASIHFDAILSETSHPTFSDKAPWATNS